MTRFGLVALILGLLNQEQLTHALAVQEQEDKEGLPHRWLGLICVELGYLERKQVDEILKHQSSLALQ